MLASVRSHWSARRSTEETRLLPGVLGDGSHRVDLATVWYVGRSIALLLNAWNASLCHLQKQLSVRAQVSSRVCSRDLGFFKIFLSNAVLSTVLAFARFFGTSHVELATLNTHPIATRRINRLACCRWDASMSRRGACS